MGVINTGVDTVYILGRISKLESKLEELLYEDVAINNFSTNKPTTEYGSTITSVILLWDINKTPTSLTLDGESIDVNSKNKVISKLEITFDNNKTWTLIATGEHGETSKMTTSVSFSNGVYYGTSSEPETYNSEFVLGLTKTLRTTKLPIFTVNAAEDKYIYYCVPSRYGKCKFIIGGFEGGIVLKETISFTNSSGYTESYDIYRSDYSGLGETIVNVQ